MTLISFCLAYAGLMALGLTNARHRPHSWNPAVGSRAVPRIHRAGWLVLCLSLLSACVAEAGTSIAIAAWLGALTVAALLSIFTLSLSPRFARALALAAPTLGIMSQIV